MFFDRWFNRQWQICLNLFQLATISWIPCSWSRYSEFLCQAIRISLVPCPFNSAPLGGWHVEKFRKHRSITRESSHRFITSGEEHPVIETKPSTNIQYSINRFLLIAQVSHSYEVSSITRKAGDRGLIIDNTDRHTTSPKATYYTKSLEVPTDNYSPYLPGSRRRKMSRRVFERFRINRGLNHKHWQSSLSQAYVFMGAWR